MYVLEARKNKYNKLKKMFSADDTIMNEYLSNETNIVVSIDKDIDMNQHYSEQTVDTTYMINNKNIYKMDGILYNGKEQYVPPSVSEEKFFNNLFK